MPNTYKTQDGKTARLVNPYNPKGQPLYADFEANNPPIPLTTERTDLIDKEFEGEVVYQYDVNDGDGWCACDENFYNAMIRHNTKFPCAVKTRQALSPLSVPVKGEEKQKLSVEEAADKVFKEQYGDYNGDRPKAVKYGFDMGFLAGHTHATNDANLVPLDRVVDELECCKELSKIDIDVLIQRIKNLTKE